MSEPAEKRPVGRPSGYDPSYCQTAIEFLSEGHSIAGLAGHLGVARQTVVNWTEQHPEFLAAVKTGQAGAVAWWEKRVRQIADGEPGNVVAAIFGLKNRAADDWRDKQHVEHSVDMALADVIDAARKRNAQP